jgi:hypothetical protein
MMWHRRLITTISGVLVLLFVASANADSVVVEHMVGDEPSQVEIML